MSDGEEEIRYTYDADGSLLQKTYGDRTHTYTYNGEERLAGYTGHDGAEVSYTYGPTGLLIKKETYSAAERYTLEEMLLIGKLSKESDKKKQENVQEGHRTLSYIYDESRLYAQVLMESSESEQTAYTYGRERIGSYRTGECVYAQYIYDVRGSVIRTQEEKVNRDSMEGAEAISYRYTPFGELICEKMDAKEDEPRYNNERIAAKQEGFLYNGEAYDEVTGSYYLRARFYEPSSMRFHQQDIIRGNAEEPWSLNRYVYAQNNPVMYEDPSGESVLPAFVGAGAIVWIGSNYVMNRGKNTTGNKTVSKTTKGYTQSTKGGITWKAVENMVVQSPIVQFGAKVVNQVKSNLTETQQKAVKQAQEVWKAIPFSTGKDVKVLNEKLSKACIAFIENGKEKTKEDIINEAVKYAIEAEDFGPLVDSEWEEYYDEDTLAEIRKRLQMYYFDHPEEHERIWDKYYKQDKRTWPEKGLLALELVGGAFSVYSGIGLVGSALGAIGGGVGGSLALAGGGTVSGASSVAVSDLLTGAIGLAGSVAGGEAIVHGLSDMTGNSSSSKGEQIPDYIKDDRVPQDKETILSGKDFQKTGKTVKGAKVYKKGDRYFYRDTFHTGESAHLEVFNKRGIHLGEVDPVTGVLRPGTADLSKILNVK